MRLLLDTHCWLWLSAAPERFSGYVRELLADRGHRLLVSAASVWEIAIKTGLGKLDLPQPPGEYMAERLERHQAEILPIDLPHAVRVAELPLHHRDPFDRMLIAQAQVEGLRLLTADAALGRYEVDLLWAHEVPAFELNEPRAGTSG